MNDNDQYNSITVVGDDFEMSLEHFWCYRCECGSWALYEYDCGCELGYW